VDDGPGGSNPRRRGFEVCPAESEANRVEPIPGDRPIFGRCWQKPPFATRIRMRAVGALPAYQPRLIDAE
jgi:hypothetical protein